MGDPWMGLWGLLLIPLAFLIGWSRRRLLAQVTLLESMGIKPTAGDPYPWVVWHTRRLWVLWGALASLILGLMHPYVPSPSSHAKGGGATQPPTAVAVVLDTSLSMGAQDGDASRLDAAIRLLQEVPWPSSMMVGLGRFEGTWEWHVPLSRDRDYFKMALTTLHAGQLPLSGSHLKSGIEVGLDMLEQWSGPKRVVLISDGGDGAGISFLLRVAQRQGIPIDTIGIGGSRPVSIPNPYSPTPSRLLQPSGELAMTRLQPEYLKEIAKMTGGTYYQNPRRFPLRRLSLPTPGSPNQTDNRWVWVTLGILLVGVGWVNSVYGSRS